jgi:hypothetical protein
LDTETVDQSAISRLVTPKPYEYKRVCERLDQQDRERASADVALMEEDTAINTFSPPSEVKVKNAHAQKVEEWVARTVKDTIFDYIKSNAMERAVEKVITERIASWSWEINMEGLCPGLNKNNLEAAMKRKVSALVCFENMREVVGKDIANAVNFEEIETIMKNQAMGEEVADGRVWK